jgi:hypothetical protein
MRHAELQAPAGVRSSKSWFAGRPVPKLHVIRRDRQIPPEDDAEKTASGDIPPANPVRVDLPDPSVFGR